MYGKTQASAKSEHDRLAGNRGSDDLQAVELQTFNLADDLLDVLRRQPNAPVGIDRDPQSGPLAQIQRSHHAFDDSPGSASERDAQRRSGQVVVRHDENVLNDPCLSLKDAAGSRRPRQTRDPQGGVAPGASLSVADRDSVNLVKSHGADAEHVQPCHDGEPDGAGADDQPAGAGRRAPAARGPIRSISVR